MLNICIQNLGMYNEGILCFEWLHLPATEEEIDAALTKIKICHTDVDGNEVRFYDECGCPYEEMHIPDWECDIKGIAYNEWATIEHYNEIAEQLDDLSEYDRHWLNAYLEATGEKFDDAIYDYQDRSRYWDGRTKSYVASEIADEEMESMIPTSVGYGCDIQTKSCIEWLQRYFDYDAFERDLDLTETSYGVIETW